MIIDVFNLIFYANPRFIHETAQSDFIHNSL